MSQIPPCPYKVLRSLRRVHHAAGCLRFERTQDGIERVAQNFHRFKDAYPGQKPMRGHLLICAIDDVQLDFQSEKAKSDPDEVNRKINAMRRFAIAASLLLTSALGSVYVLLNHASQKVPFILQLGVFAATAALVVRGLNGLRKIFPDNAFEKHTKEIQDSLEQAKSFVQTELEQ